MKQFDKHIIITGSARSGTSWLSELLARQFRYRMLFEPEHEFNTEKGKLLCDRWIKNREEALQAHQYLKRVFKNRVDSDWIGQISNRKFKMHLWPFIPKKYIIKFVRANLSAKYMNETFKIPVIHIVRNPYDVLVSQQRVKFPWLYNLEHFKKQNELVRSVKAHFDFNLLEDAKDLSEPEILALRWCLENVLPLQVFEPYQYKHRVLKYEALREDLQIFLSLCNDFDLEPLANIENEYKRPSSKTHPKSSIMGTYKNPSNFSTAEIEKINTILERFKLTLYPIKKTKVE